jgi:hypothetical protein
MAFPTFLVGPLLNTLSWARRLHQSRRRVKLTVHRANLAGPFAMVGGKFIDVSTDSYFITITNASRDRDIVVTHVWLETDPELHVHDVALPVRLKYSAPRKLMHRARGTSTSYWKQLRLQALQRYGHRCVLRVDRRCTQTATTVHISPHLKGDHRAATLADCKSACRTCHGIIDGPRAGSEQPPRRATNRIEPRGEGATARSAASLPRNLAARKTGWEPKTSRFLDFGESGREKSDRGSQAPAE